MAEQDWGVIFYGKTNAKIEGHYECITRQQNGITTSPILQGSKKDMGCESLRSSVFNAVLMWTLRSFG